MQECDHEEMGIAPSREEASNSEQIKQDKFREVEVEGKSTETQPSHSATANKAKAAEKTGAAPLALAHNYEAILKDAGPPADNSSKERLHEQLCAGVLLNQNTKASPIFITA